MIELKPCPFCGVVPEAQPILSKRHGRWHASVKCYADVCKSRLVVVSAANPSKAEAEALVIRRWNARAPVKEDRG